MSSTLVRTFRFSTQQNVEDRRQGKQPEGLALTRTSSLSMPSGDTNAASDTHIPVASASTSSFIQLGQSSSLADAPNALPSPKRARGSIIMANLPFGRSKARKSVRPHTAPRPQSYLFSEVIEITARREDDGAERDRLRDAAAQSIGLDPILLEEQAEHSAQEHTEESGVSSSAPHTPTPASTPTPALVFPTFPATAAALQPFKQLSSRFSKYYHPPSLLMFALSRQWKPRELILTTSPESVSHLHVFKSAAAHERELERLEIGADSVVFVAEEEVAGKRGVVKVGGINGAEMALHNINSSEAQNWIAAIKHAVLSQRSVRAGLGVMHPAQNGVVEPRGDLDVMLSMRAQGMLPSQSPPSTPIQEQVRSRSGSTSSLRSSAPQRTPSTTVSAFRGLFSGSTTRPRSPSAASTSTSIYTDDGSDTQPEDSFGRAGASLLGMLRSNGSMNERPLSPTSLTQSTLTSNPSTPLVSSFHESQIPSSLDKKILEDSDRDIADWTPLTKIDFNSGNGAITQIDSLPENKLQIFGSSSLQPPPRRRAWTSSGPPRGPRSQPDKISHSLSPSESSSTTEKLSMRLSNGSAFLAQPQVAPSSTHSQEEQQRPRTASSIHSASTNTHTSVDRRSSLDSGGGKRWSRQGIILHRLTPPSGPLPPAPAASSPPSKSPPSFRSSMQRHPYASEDSPSRPSSSRSNTPHSQGGGMSPQSLSKRMSTSSAQSNGTSEGSHSRLTSGGVTSLFGQRPRSSHRVSVPPPQRPAPIAALPPTPNEDTDLPKHPRSASPTRTTFRESLSLRLNRHSLSPPSHPPSSALPTVPNQNGSRSHRRSSSTGNNGLFPIPASPSPLDPPFPPPSGPLPPPPSQAASALPHSRQAISIRHRLRMLSAPSSSPPINPVPPNPPSPAPSTINPYSLPPTPIAEPITIFQSDPSFLLGAPTPLTPPQPPRILVLDSSPDFALTSLSPPPRRGSRRRSVPDTRKSEHTSDQPQLDETDDRSSTPVLSSPAGPSMLFTKPSAVSLVDVGKVYPVV